MSRTSNSRLNRFWNVKALLLGASTLPGPLPEEEQLDYVPSIVDSSFTDVSVRLIASNALEEESDEIKEAMAMAQEELDIGLTIDSLVPWEEAHPEGSADEYYRQYLFYMEFTPEGHIEPGNIVLQTKPVATSWVVFILVEGTWLWLGECEAMNDGYVKVNISSNYSGPVLMLYHIPSAE